MDIIDAKPITQVCTPCLMCGEPVTMTHLQDSSIKICDDCKRLWKELKAKRSDNNAE